MKQIVLYLTLGSLLLSLTSNTHADTGVVSLGNMQFTDADATSLKIAERLTIDGKANGDDNGWGLENEHLASSEPQHITWTWETFSAPPLTQGESISHYTYTINLHNGINFFNLNWLLKSYNLAFKDPNTDNFTTITDYQSLSNTQEAAEKGHTLSVDANGLITTTEANQLNVTDIHTLVFQSAKLSNQLRLVFPDPSQGGWDEPGDGWVGRSDDPDYRPGYTLIREITGSVTANVVIPEPSAYALILGLIALGFAFKRRK